MSAGIPTRPVRIKNFIEFFRDFGGVDDPHPDQSTFVYVDSGEDVPDDEAVSPGDNSPEHLRHLSDILTAYASDKGYSWMEIGGEI